MAVKHVQRLTVGGKRADTVHAVILDGLTMCGWNFVSKESFSGRPIYLAADSQDKVNCGKCIGKMRVRARLAIAVSTADELERFLDL